MVLWRITSKEIHQISDSVKGPILINWSIWSHYGLIPRSLGVVWSYLNDGILNLLVFRFRDVFDELDVVGPERHLVVSVVVGVVVVVVPITTLSFLTFQSNVEFQFFVFLMWPRSLLRIRLTTFKKILSLPRLSTLKNGNVYLALAATVAAASRRFTETQKTDFFKKIDCHAYPNIKEWASIESLLHFMRDRKNGYKINSAHTQ